MREKGRKGKEIKRRQWIQKRRNKVQQKRKQRNEMSEKRHEKFAVEKKEREKKNGKKMMYKLQKNQTDRNRRTNNKCI